MNVAINGFGRIGKAVLLSLLNEKYINISLVNDLNPNIDNVCYLINYDSTYGKLSEKAFKIKENLFKIKNKEIKYTSKKKIDEINLKNIDVLIECTGRDWSLSSINKLKNKIKNIIITNIPKKLNFKYLLSDINLNELDKKNFIISSGTCDGNAIVPIMKILLESFKIESGNITTLHPWLSYQNLLDGPLKSISDPKNMYSTYVLGRSSVNNIIPKTTSVVDVASKIFPIIKKKITSLSYRVPTDIVSCAELNITLKNKIKLNEVKKKLIDFENNQSSKLIKNFNFPLTSLDLKGSTYSSNIDHRWINVNSRQLRIVTWYDNEMGYAARVADILKKITHL